MVPSRNTPFRPVELGIKRPVHVTDRGPPDAEASTGKHIVIYRGLGQRGLIHPQPHYPSLPRTSSVVEISQNKFGWRTGCFRIEETAVLEPSGSSFLFRGWWPRAVGVQFLPGFSVSYFARSLGGERGERRERKRERKPEETSVASRSVFRKAGPPSSPWLGL